MKILVTLMGLMLANTAVAGELGSDSFICLSQGGIEEAAKAVAHSDEKWLGSLRGCYQTTKAMKAERIDCGLETCKARIWPSDTDSVVVYTFRRELH